jgi:hypothetical protein
MRIMELLAAVVLCCVPGFADAYSPARPKPALYVSADQGATARITPAVAPPGDKPTARVQGRDTGGRVHTLWEGPLANRVGPTSALLANGGKYLVTFNDWGEGGMSDCIVAIYDWHGSLVRKFGIEQFLPPEYAAQLPRYLNSLEWGGVHRLVEHDTLVELQVAEPGQRHGARTRFLPLRIRLADGEVLAPGGADWQAALAKARTLDAPRQAHWQRYRSFHARALPAPRSADAEAWTAYATEIRDRIAFRDDTMVPLVLPVTGGAEFVDGWLRGSANTPYTRLVFVSPDSGRLASLLERSLSRHSAGALAGMEVVFVGTAGEGALVRAAAKRAGARITLFDVALPIPPGKSLPAQPPLLWTARDWPR